MPESEIGRLRRLLEEEYTAATRGLHGSAIVARHSFITKRMENMEDLRAKLATHVGEEKSIEIVSDVMAKEG